MPSDLVQDETVRRQQCADITDLDTPLKRFELSVLHRCVHGAGARVLASARRWLYVLFVML